MTRNTKIGLVVGVVVGAMALSHLLLGHDVDDIYYKRHPWEVKGNEEAQSAEGDAHAGHDHGSPSVLFELPEPSGPEKAPVRLDVYLQAGDSCVMPSLSLIGDIQAIYPKHLRVVYHDTNDPLVAKAAGEQKISCKMGVLVNGKIQHRVPGRGKYGMVTLDGPPSQGKFTRDDLIAVVDLTLRAKGVDLTKVKVEPPKVGAGLNAPPQ